MPLNSDVHNDVIQGVDINNLNPVNNVEMYQNQVSND